MKQFVHTMSDLYQMQSLSLEAKIRMTDYRIDKYIEVYGEEGTYIAFSGGKDSRVLLHRIRSRYPSIPAVYSNTGMEYPQIVKFVNQFENVEIVYPKMTFKQIVDEYGYPLITKEVSNKIEGARNYIEKIKILKNTTEIESVRQDIDTLLYMIENYSNNKELLKHYIDKIDAVIPEKKKGSYKLRQSLGLNLDKKGNPSAYNVPKRYRFLLNSPYKISAKCCDILKKEPAKEYEEKTGRKKFIGTMADEGELRKKSWLMYGCNVYEGEIKSAPLSFWTTNDILEYIVKYDLDIPSVYGDIVEEKDETGKSIYRTTKCQRTGCMYCGFGCHLKNDKRFELLSEELPKTYEFIMRKENGINYSEVIDYINTNSKLKINKGAYK